MLVEVPAPRWQIGAFGAGLALADALSAQSLLLAGAVPTAEAERGRRRAARGGLRSYFSGRTRSGSETAATLSVQAIEADRTYERDAVISFGYEVVRPGHVPTFAGPLLETLRDLELRVRGSSTARASRCRSAARRTWRWPTRSGSPRGGSRSCTWAARSGASSSSGASWSRGRGDAPEARLARLGVTPEPVDVAARAQALASCAGSAGAGASGDELCPTRGVTAACDLSAAIELFRRYTTERNPYYLRAHFATQTAGPGGAPARADAPRAGVADAPRAGADASRAAVAVAPRAGGGGCGARRGGGRAAWERAGRAAGRGAMPCGDRARRDHGAPVGHRGAAGEAQLLPIDGALVAVPGAAVPGGSRLRRAVTVGTSALRVEAAGPGAAPQRATP